MAPAYQQDMPPKGGYGPIEWVKKIPRTGIKGWKLLAGYAIVGLTTFTLQEYLYITIKRKQMLEDREYLIVMEPFIFAERGRQILKQLRANRDEERELMKDVPNWKVGHLYDQPVFHNLSKRWMPPPAEEIFAHAPYKVYKRAVHEHVYH